MVRTRLSSGRRLQARSASGAYGDRFLMYRHVESAACARPANLCFSSRRWQNAARALRARRQHSVIDGSLYSSLV